MYLNGSIPLYLNECSPYRLGEAPCREGDILVALLPYRRLPGALRVGGLEETHLRGKEPPEKVPEPRLIAVHAVHAVHTIHMEMMNAPLQAD